jgi:DNA-binding transcriptional ArsR family regulator
LAETALVYSRLKPPAAATDTRVLRAVRQQATASDRALASYLWMGAGAGLDLFTIAGRTSTITAGREAILDGPGDVWQVEVGAWGELRAEARRRGLLAPVTVGRADIELALTRGDAEPWQRLLRRMEDRFSSWIGPSWPAIRDRLDAEEARLAHRAAAGGLGSLFTALGHGIRWTGTSLDLPGAGISGTHTSVIELGGRGLTIVPSFFALEPMVWLPAELTAPALLTVPCSVAEGSRGSQSDGERRGAELLGRTRAAVLAQVARGPRTTSQLSQELGIAISGASQHASVLRRAGLITTTREGGHVQHVITELGESLLSRL